MNRRDFIKAATLAASALVAGVEAPAPPISLDGYVFIKDEHPIRGFLDPRTREFVQVDLYVFVEEHDGTFPRFNPAYFTAPIQIELWAKNHTDFVCVARDVSNSKI